MVHRGPLWSTVVSCSDATTKATRQSGTTECPNTRAEPVTLSSCSSSVFWLNTCSRRRSLTNCAAVSSGHLGDTTQTVAETRYVFALFDFSLFGTTDPLPLEFSRSNPNPSVSSELLVTLSERVNYSFNTGKPWLFGLIRLHRPVGRQRVWKLKKVMTG